MTSQRNTKVKTCCLCFQVKRFLGEVDSNLQHINDLRQELKNNLPFGALPETAESQYTTFVVRTTYPVLLQTSAVVVDATLSFDFAPFPR